MIFSSHLFPPKLFDLFQHGDSWWLGGDFVIIRIPHFVDFGFYGNWESLQGVAALAF